MERAPVVAEGMNNMPKVVCLHLAGRRPVSTRAAKFSLDILVSLPYLIEGRRAGGGRFQQAA
jgi:hypothetical protein